MYLVERPMPKGCKDCKAFVKYEKAYDDPIGCIYGVAGSDKRRKDRPAECPIIDADDDLK